MFTSSLQWSADKTAGREGGRQLTVGGVWKCCHKQHHQLPEIKACLGYTLSSRPIPNRPSLHSENRACVVAMALDVIPGIVKPNSETK